MKIINKIPYVPVFLNEEGPFQFLFDTGCWAPRISFEVSDHLNLERTDRDLTRLDTLRLSEVVFRDFDICVDDMSIMSKRGRAQVDGITGFDLVKESIVIFDYRSHRFNMCKSDQFSNRESLSSNPLPLTIANRYPLTEVIVNGNGPYHFLVDTGSMGTNVSTEIAEHLNLVMEREVTIRGSRPNDAQLVYESKVSKMEVGEAMVSDIKVLVKSCDANSAHAKTKVDGVIGYEFLKEFGVVMDYHLGELRLLP